MDIVFSIREKPSGSLRTFTTSVIESLSSFVGTVEIFDSKFLNLGAAGPEKVAIKL